MLQVAGRLIPSVFQPKVLSVGLLVGEWSEIGIDSSMDAGSRDAAGTMALDALKTLAVERKCDVVSLYNFNQYGRLPEKISSAFTRVHYRSCATLTIDFSSMDEYLSRLSKGARKDLRRKMRAAVTVRVVRSQSIAPWLDRVYKLYLETVARSPMAFGALKRFFFEKICETVPGAEYTLYFVEEELVAFNLLVVNQQAMEDKFFCMDYELGRRYNLYFLSWLENVRTCLERKIPAYHAGQGTEEVKAHLGATFIPSFILFRHRQPLINRFLAAWPAVNGRLLSLLGFWPKAKRSS
jgi:predicted N-acyltransferase